MIYHLLNLLSSFKGPSLYQIPGSKCKPCPVVHPSPVCGTDGHTYSTKVHTVTSPLTHNRDIRAHEYIFFFHFLSTRHTSWFYFHFCLVPSVSVTLAQCKLDYQACITGKKIAVKCSGMCPCPSQPEQSSAEKKGTRFCTHDCTLQARILCRRNSTFSLIIKSSMVSKPMLNPCTKALVPC